MQEKGALACAAALAIALGSATAAEAETAEANPNAELVKQLATLQAQVEALQARLDAYEQRQAAPPRGRVIETAPTPPAPAAPATAAWDGAPRFTGAGSTFKVRGRLILDAVRQDVDRPGTVNDLKLAQVRGRQAFLGVEGEIGPNWAYKLEGGAVNGGGWAWDDAYLQYSYDKSTQVLIGNQKGFGYENLTSTRFTRFMDRGPYDNLIDATYQLGVYVWKSGPGWTFNVGVTGDSLNSGDVSPTGASSNRHERLITSTRVTYTPLRNAGSILHLGAWARYRKHGDDGPFTYAAGYFSPYRPLTLLTAGPVGDHDATFGAEALYIRHSFSLQGEFADIRVSRDQSFGPARDFDIRTGYAMLGFFPTGETRAYSPAGDGRVRVKSPLTNGGIGSWELLARYDFADLGRVNDLLGIDPQGGGSFNGWSLGATWRPIDYVRFMANYSHGKTDNPGRANDATTDVFQMRGQLDF